MSVSRHLNPCMYSFNKKYQIPSNRIQSVQSDMITSHNDEPKKEVGFPEFTKYSASHFDLVPIHIVEHIMQFLPEKEVSQLALVSRTFHEASSNVVGKQFSYLSQSLADEMQDLICDIAAIPCEEAELVLAKLPLLRSYFVFELLHSEIGMVKSLSSDLIENGTGMFAMGKLVEEYRRTLNVAKDRNLPAWQMNDPVTSRMFQVTKQFVDRKHTTEDFYSHFGKRLINLFETVIDKEEVITVKYRPMAGEAFIMASYRFRNPKYLSRPPRLLDDTSLIPSREDVKRILSFVANLVRINNRVLLREEAYFREVEAVRRAQDLNDLEVLTSMGSGWLTKKPRDYANSHIIPHRSIIWENSEPEIKLVIRSPEVRSGRESHARGFSCNIDMKCQLDKLPELLAYQWKKLKVDVFGGVLYGDNWVRLRKELAGLDARADTEASQARGGQYELDCSINVMLQHTIAEMESYTLRFVQNDP